MGGLMAALVGVGNGYLNEYIEYHNDQAITVSWIAKNGRVSTWKREMDNSSTDVGTEENLKESWWNMTEEWEGEKCALRAKIHKINVEAYDEQDGKSPKRATRKDK